MNNNYLENTVVIEMNGVVHTCRNIACNSDYMDITEKGLEIEITTTDGGWAWLYVLENRKRIPEIKISFRSNNQAGYKLMDKAIKTRRSSHLGRALLEANILVTLL